MSLSLQDQKELRNARVSHTRALTNSEWASFDEGFEAGLACRDKQNEISPDSKDWKLVPIVPTEAQWGGLARSIFLGWECNCNTPRALFRHLEMSGTPIPQWLRD